MKPFRHKGKEGPNTSQDSELKFRTGKTMKIKAL
jgi:hypothetical protein